MRRSCTTRHTSAATLLSGVGVLFAMGCSSGQQSGVPNPFFSADRVPPPATRIIPQGTAQPYYPNQATPSFQGGAIPANTPWNGTGQSDITPIPAGSFSAAPSTSSPETAVRSLASEPSIAVPTDGGDLRFASVPSPATRVDVAPLAGAGPPAITGTLPPRGTTTLPTPLTNSPTTIAPSPAVANSSMGTAGPQVTLTPVQSSTPESTFRDPAVPASGTAAPQPFPSDVPRIRLPQGSQSPSEPVAVPGGIQTMSYQMELPPAGAPQLPPTTNATPPAMYPAPPTQGVAPFGVAPSGVVPAAYSTQVPQPPNTPDGFQPRGEARRRAEQQQSSTVVPATFASATLPGTGQQAYGYGASYEWLQGRLEYSAILGHWTLRYMPIGGPSDSFGGSVVIYNSDALAGYQPGDFVTMQGQLVATGIDPSMPVAYSVYTIQRQ